MPETSQSNKMARIVRAHQERWFRNSIKYAKSRKRWTLIKLFVQRSWLRFPESQESDQILGCGSKLRTPCAGTTCLELCMYSRPICIQHFFRPHSPVPYIAGMHSNSSLSISALDLLCKKTQTKEGEVNRWPHYYNDGQPNMYMHIPMRVSFFLS